MKRRRPGDEIRVVERNRPYDTFGWGVVLSDETLVNLNASDPESAEAIRQSFVYWDDIAVSYRGTITRSSGHGFCGIGRKRLLNILQDRARALGVTLLFDTEFESADAYRHDYDLVVVARHPPVFAAAGGRPAEYRGGAHVPRLWTGQDQTRSPSSSI
jgi:anthraniloyl-CoA monooxygenase